MTSLWLDTCRPTPRPAGLPVGKTVDVAVIGAGLTGLTTAALLARAGKRVVVIEARHVGAVATGNTTAKLSLLQGSVLSQMRSHHSGKLVRAYVEGNREGQDWLVRLMDDRAVPYERRVAWTYATTARGRDKLADELDAAREAGLPVAPTTDTELPFPARAIRLGDQVQIHPTLVLQALLDELEGHGGQVVEGVRLTGLRAGKPCTLETTGGELRAEDVVLATGTPVLDRGLYFAKLEAHRSYALAFEVPGTIPAGMYLSLDQATRSLRTSAAAGGEQLLVGGNGHVVGRGRSEQACVDDLIAWTDRHFPGAALTHQWSAQDYQPAGRVPFVGAMPRSRGHVYVATGYDKWGMTNGVAAALTLSREILGGELGDWMKTLRHRVTGPRDLASGLRANAAVGAHLARGWAGVATGRAYATSDSAPPQAAEGKTGTPGQSSIEQPDQQTPRVGAAGPDCRLSRVCTHLGGIVEWNDAEGSWDCPLHGSRFAPDGSVLEGPATEPLKRD